MEGWVVVFSCDNLFKGELVRQHLSGNGIEAVIVNKKDSFYITIGDVEVHVALSDAEAATDLLKDF